MKLANPLNHDPDWGLRLAGEATDRLSQQAQIDAVCVLGSVARGESHAGSDIDLMLITHEPTRPSKLYPQLNGLEAISLIVHTRESFQRLSASRAIFAIHVRDEGKVLFDRDRWLTEQLQSLAGQRADPSSTYRWANQEVARYRDLARFNGIYHFAFARLYSISRAVAIGITVDKGDPQYGKDEPFSWIATELPTLRDPVKRLSALRAFREIEGGYDQLARPFDDRGADSEMRQAVADLETLLSATDELKTDSTGDLRLHR
jgi:predicted nucleotidyltransferase